MELLKHKKNRDTAIQIIRKEGNKYFVNFWNIALARIGLFPQIVGDGLIKLQPLKYYTVIEM